MNPNGAIIVQSNLEILVEIHNPNYESAREAIAPFTELVTSQENLHTYRISHLSLWNAAATGLTAKDIEERLESQSKYPIPVSVLTEIEDYMGRYGLLQLRFENCQLILSSEDPVAFMEISQLKEITPFIEKKLSSTSAIVNAERRGHIKMALTLAGFPVEDLAGYTVGDPLPLKLRETTLSGKPFELRHYQKEAAQIFYASG